MAEGSETSTAYKAAIDLVCSSVEILNRATGESRAIGDVMLFELAKEIKMKPGGRAARFVDHFLFGGGEAIYFPCAQLLTEDSGVRRVVTGEISQRLAVNPALVKKSVSGGEYVIPIRQRDFADDDWMLALGSYAIVWEVVAVPSDRSRVYARVSGANEYKWHPAAPRVTQCIHQAGDRLTRTKEVRAKNFWMIAQPCTFDVITGKPVAS